MSVRVLRGDCREVLRTLPSESVHCCVTSPPYWSLRDYGVEGQLGLEGSFQEYIEIMRWAVFAEVRRVLRGDGTLWLNMGDSYAANVNGRSANDVKLKGLDDRTFRDKPFLTIGNGLKPKDLCGIPWRLALALQADGWYLRSDIIWSKPNPMPESVTDRPTKAHEYLFLLSKSERYFYDADAIREPGVTTFEEAQSKWGTRRNGKGKGQQEGVYHSHKNIKPFQNDPNPLGRNRRTVWEISTSPFPEAHFATFPPALVEPCIKAGTSEKGCCAKCGAPWVREVEVEQIKLTGSTGQPHVPNAQNWAGITDRTNKHVTTIGWSPSCSCDTAVVPCTVLDPFGGAGTTGLVADRLGRNAILIELNEQYAGMAEQRLRNDAGMFAEVVSA